MDAFCRRLHPATLLIKAAPDSLWVCPEQEAPADDHLAYARCIKRALQPAHSHLGCGVVSDSCQVDAETPPKIFREPPEQACWCADGSEDHFGYGCVIFFSQGDNLAWVGSPMPYL